MATEHQQKCWIKEGRGQGYLKDYKPWITIRDISSKGRSHRVFGHTTKRTHHLLSDLELAIFLLLDWNPLITDIREQFPLPLNATLEISEQAKISHPKVRDTLQTISSSFYVNSQTADQPNFAIRTKYTNDLQNERIIEKLELERRYWKSTKTPWYILTEKEIPLVILNNIKWLYPAMRESSTTIYDQLNLYIHIFTQYPELNLIDLSKKIDQSYNLPIGASLAELRELLAQRYFIFDITKDYKKIKASEIKLGNFEIWEEIRHVSNQ